MKDRNLVAFPRPVRRVWSIGLFALLLVLVPASSALAGTVTTNFGTSVVTYNAAGGETNTVTFSGSRGAVTVADSTAPVTVGGGGSAPGCTQDNPNQVTCTPPAGSTFGEFVRIIANLNDLNDSVTVGGSLDGIDFRADGGDGNDTINVGVAQGGNVNGGLGDDSITGGRFGDALFGNAGNDIISGGGGDDNISGGLGNDQLNGDAGRDTVNGDEGDDTITGGTGDDGNLAGGDGNDSVSGGDGDDGNGFLGLSGGRGADNVQGDNGDDILAADEDGVSDTYGGGAGNDTVDYRNYAGAVTISLDGAANDGGAGENDAVVGDIENALGGQGDDTITGNDGTNRLGGGDGNDAITAAGGDDIVFGDAGNDALSGGEGRDDVVGGQDNDVLNGDNADDILEGDGGADTFNGGGGIDTADYQYAGLPQNITLDKAANDGSAGEGDNVDADGSVENVLGGFGNDNITGNAAVNFIDSGFGNDQINVRDGSFLTDIVSCGPGYDVVAADALDAIDTTDVNRCENAPVFPITRVKPKLTVKVSPKTNRKFPKTFTVSGKLTPGVVPTSAACDNSASFVAISFKKGKNTISTRRVQVSASCSYSAIVSFTDRKRLGKAKSLRIVAVFSGNKFLTTASKTTSARIR